MRRIIIMTFILGLAASVAWAQDTTKVTAQCACFLSGGGCGCRVRPVNDYSGLNSLRSRLANPSWDGRLPGIGTGLRLEEGRIRPLSGTTIRTEPDTPETSSATFADKSHTPKDPYLRWEGERRPSERRSSSSSVWPGLPLPTLRSWWASMRPQTLPWRGT